MDRLSKGLVVFIILIMATSGLSLMLAKPAFAQLPPKPSVPEFTVKYVDRSYDVPLTTTTTTDPYTGKQITTNSGGYHVQNRTMELTIRNQFFNSYYDSNTQRDYGLYYNVSSRGHFGGGWSYSSSPISASNSQYTILIFGLNGRESTENMVDLGNLDLGSVLDFKVQALVGYYAQINDSPTIGAWWGHWEFTGQSSGWSSTQIITVGETSASASPNPTLLATPTSTVPEFPTWIVLAFFASVLLISVYIAYRRVSHE